MDGYTVGHKSTYGAMHKDEIFLSDKKRYDNGRV